MWTDEEQKELESWQKEYGVDRAACDGKTLTLSGLSGESSYPDKLSFWLQLSHLKFEDTMISEDWFLLIERYTNITEVSLNSPKFLRNPELPAHVTTVELSRLRDNNQANIIKKNCKTIKALRLKEINISSNLQKFIQSMTELEQLDLESITPMGTLGTKSKLKHLRLCQIESEPTFNKWVEGLRGLEYIDITGTLFRNISSELISSAKTLKISASEITTLPEYSGSALKCLSLSQVDINCIPESYMQENLTTLYVSNSGIEVLPKKLSKLPFLEELSISKTKISSLPVTMKSTKRLRKIDFSSSKIRHLPRWLKDATALEYLDISSCNLIDIEPDISLPLIQHLDVKNERGSWDNQQSSGFFVKHLKIEGYDPRYLTQGNAKFLLPYFYDAHKKCSHEARVIVSGDTQEVRSIIIRSLLENDIWDESIKLYGFSTMDLTAPELSNHGRYSESVNSNIYLPNDILIHVNELSSDPEYEIAHELFYTDNCVYVIGINFDNTLNVYAKLKKHINTIGQYTSNASIVFCIMSTNKIVSNEIICSNLAIIATKVQKISICNISLSNEEERIDKIANTVFSSIATLKSFEWQIPQSWWSIKYHIEKLFLEYSHISQETFREVCISHLNLSKDYSPEGLSYIFESILDWLRDMETISTFTANERMLPSTIYNKRWLAGCVYGILHYSKEMSGNTTLNNIWNMADECGDEVLLNSHFRQHSQELLEALQNIGLCIKGNTTNTPGDTLLRFPFLLNIFSVHQSCLFFQKSKFSAFHTTDLNELLTHASMSVDEDALHYTISMDILTQSFYSSFLCNIHNIFENKKLNQKNKILYKNSFILVGREGAIIIFSDSFDADKSSCCLFVTGIPGNPADIHVHASGTSHSKQTRKKQNLLWMSSIAFEAFTATLNQQQMKGLPEQCTIFFEERQGDETSLIPLDDIMLYKETGRRDYFCAPLKKTINVNKKFASIYPNI